jgi:histidine ammonia-lyase
VAIELICASEAVEFRVGEKLGVGSSKAFEFVRAEIPRLSEDRSLTPDITRLTDAILDGRLVDHVEKDTGELGC